MDDDAGALGWETDSFGYPLADQPHPDAYFDPMWRSRHGPKSMDGWRFAVRCKAGCPDAISSMPATRPPESVSEWTCPDCDGPCEIFNPEARPRPIASSFNYPKIPDSCGGMLDLTRAFRRKPPGHVHR